MKQKTGVVAVACLLIGLLGADQPAPGLAKLLKGQIVYSPPHEWELSIDSSNETTAAWSQTDGAGILAIQALPANAAVDNRAADAMVKQLHNGHVKAKDEVLLEPKREADDRFAIRIHERFKHGQQVSDELHLYKLVGSRPCMLTVNAQTDNESEARKIHVIGEDVLLSAKFVKKSIKD